MPYLDKPYPNSTEIHIVLSKRTGAKAIQLWSQIFHGGHSGWGGAKLGQLFDV